jgi:hypothetical protein
MIQITRSLARQLRAVFRRLGRRSAGTRPVVSFHAGADGLRARLHLQEVVATYHQPGDSSPEVITLPMDALAEFEGRADTPVSLYRTESGTTIARWEDGVIPQEREYNVDDPDKLPNCPDLPSATVANEPTLWNALAEALESTSQVVISYAVDKLQLRGSSGSIVATNGKQLLVQTGFQFPWPDDVLVPASPVFACRELAQVGPVTIGRTDTYVTLQAGAWTLQLLIAKEGRYPDIEQVIPSPAKIATRCRLDPTDVAFLVKTLPHLPKTDDEHEPITVDLNGQVCVRASGGSGQGRTTEIVLARSETNDNPVRVCLNRAFLARAVGLGLGEIGIVNADSPLVFQDDRRKFVVMPLDKNLALAPREDAFRIVSAEGEQRPKTNHKEKKRSVMATSPTNGAGNGTSNGAAPLSTTTESSGNGESIVGSPIGEAQALMTMLHDSYKQASRLVTAMKRQRRQSKLVQSTIASLRQLQQIGG